MLHPVWCSFDNNSSQYPAFIQWVFSFPAYSTCWLSLTHTSFEFEMHLRTLTICSVVAVSALPFASVEFYALKAETVKSVGGSLAPIGITRRLDMSDPSVGISRRGSEADASACQTDKALVDIVWVFANITAQFDGLTVKLATCIWSVSHRYGYFPLSLHNAQGEGYYILSCT